MDEQPDFLCFALADPLCVCFITAYGAATLHGDAQCVPWGRGSFTPCRGFTPYTLHTPPLLLYPVYPVYPRGEDIPHIPPCSGYTPYTPVLWIYPVYPLYPVYPVYPCPPACAGKSRRGVAAELLESYQWLCNQYCMKAVLLLLLAVGTAAAPHVNFLQFSQNGKPSGAASAPLSLLRLVPGAGGREESKQIVLPTEASAKLWPKRPAPLFLFGRKNDPKGAGCT